MAGVPGQASGGPLPSSQASYYFGGSSPPPDQILNTREENAVAMGAGILGCKSLLLWDLCDAPTGDTATTSGSVCGRHSIFISRHESPRDGA